MAGENRFVRRTDVYSLPKNVMPVPVWSLPRSTCKTELRVVSPCSPQPVFVIPGLILIFLVRGCRESVICCSSAAPFRLARTFAWRLIAISCYRRTHDKHPLRWFIISGKYIAWHVRVSRFLRYLRNDFLKKKKLLLHVLLNPCCFPKFPKIEYSDDSLRYLIELFLFIYLCSTCIIFHNLYKVRRAQKKFGAKRQDLSWNSCYFPRWIQFQKLNVITIVFDTW